ncbi:MAG: VCBS repeat-containing protein [Acidobacteria bacterium]|nr:VCBS repeat-containing protein [Acidobacteriota bacterium]
MKRIIILIFLNLLAIATFAADGDLDASFGGTGIVTETFYPVLSANFSVVVQPDGKIISAGYTSDLNGQSDFSLVRYNADGSLDAAFGANGRTTADNNGKTDQFPEIFVLPGGRILLVGQSQDTLDHPAIAIFRFNANGSPDTTFGTGGRVLSAFTTSGTRGDTLGDALVQADGKILVTGQWQGTSFCVGRFNADGALDTNFGSGGSVCAQTVPLGSGVMRSLALQPDGKILAAGKHQTSFTAPSDFIVFRFNANGSPDATFDSDGYAITDLNANFDEAFSVHALPDGKIVAAGRGGISGSSQYGFGIARYNADGSLDAGFDGDGKTVQLARNTAGTERYSAVVLANGKIVAARHVSPVSGVFDDGQVARFSANGALDQTFGAGGQVLFPDIRIINAMTEQADGKILFVGVGEDVKARTVRLANTDAAPPAANPALRVADFDGDGKTDASVFRSGTWFVSPSGAPGLAPNVFYGVQWGAAGDKIAPADYDGDGKTDIAVWRESEGNFYILNSSNNAVRVENFGLAGDVLTVGDYDGDGRADLSVYRDGAQSYFFYRGSSNNPAGNITYLPWGTTGDKAVRGDFDGDRKLDVAVFRTSNQTWYIRRSSDNQIVYRIFGLGGDKLVPGDYDGDGKSDVAVFRGGTWYILQSSNDQVRYQNWGANTDTLAPGDYDGDGKTDAAVWRGGVYYILNSASAAVSYQYFGATGDAPVAAAFIQ